MTEILKKGKNNDALFNDYIAIISANCEKHMVFPAKLQKVDDEKISIPTINNYNTILQYNYSLSQLKSILKYYKLKVGGNKSELLNRIYSHLYLSKNSIKIQRIFRGKLARDYFKGKKEGWNPIWNSSKASNHPPTIGLWAVEPHLGFKDVGAKWEELLVVTEDDAFWLDDDVPQVRRWKQRGLWTA